MSDYLQVGDLRVGVNMVREYRERIAFLERESANQKACLEMFHEHEHVAVTRVEVIDANGRSYQNHKVTDCRLSYQDYRRTLKVFVGGSGVADRPDAIPVKRELGINAEVDCGFVVQDGKCVPTVEIRLPMCEPGEDSAWDQRDAIGEAVRALLASQEEQTK